MSSLDDLRKSNPTKTCPVCGKTFTFTDLEESLSYRIGRRDWEKRVFCSSSCSKSISGAKVMKELKYDDEVPSHKTCPVCGVKFPKPLTESKRVWLQHTYCSLECTYSDRQGKQPEWLIDKAFQLGHEPWHKGRSSTYANCRICGKRFPTHGKELLVSCPNPECREASKKLRAENASKALKQMWENGEFDDNDPTWNLVPTVTSGEIALAPYLEPEGWETQYKVPCNPPDMHNRTYHLDFAYPEEKLYVEIDGSSHLKPDRIEKDNLRTKLLGKKGWQGIRFWEREAKNSPEMVYEQIWDWIVKVLE